MACKEKMSFVSYSENMRIEMFRFVNKALITCLQLIKPNVTLGLFCLFQTVKVQIEGSNSDKKKNLN